MTTLTKVSTIADLLPKTDLVKVAREHYNSQLFDYLRNIECLICEGIYDNAVAGLHFSTVKFNCPSHYRSEDILYTLTRKLTGKGYLCAYTNVIDNVYTFIVYWGAYEYTRERLLKEFANS